MPGSLRQPGQRVSAGPEEGSLRRHAWKRFLRGPDPELLKALYVPALSEAIRYDRCCAYFSSSVLSAAARGFGKLIERLESLGDKAPRPAVRLVVNEELPEDDVRALTETGDLSKLEELLRRRFRSPTDLLEKERLAMLGWLVKQGLLAVRVGVMRRGEGIVHAKFGIASDGAGDAVVFSGSGNESAQGILGNYERLDISTSWEDADRHREYRDEFQALWEDTHPHVHTVSLPEALRLKLVKLAPREAPVSEPANVMARQRAAMIWSFIVEAPYLPNGGAACDATAMVDLWPHQRHVVKETAEAWPEGRLLCDEVGMGKTIEAILILRRLLAGRGARRVLILLPAGLLSQWQGELREKGGLVFPRLEGTNALIWPDERIEKVASLGEALERDVLLMSRETARTENNAPVLLAATPWDLVVLDESHAARRREQEEGTFNSGTLLLNLLRNLQLERRARGFLLMSATPMQTHPWEPWDLLAVLGEGDAWLSEFSVVGDYYRTIVAVQDGRCDMETARKAAALVAADPNFVPPQGEAGAPRNAAAIASRIAFVPPSRKEETARWLRRVSPLSRRMHRNTRRTLRRYHQLGLLPQAPPIRVVEDIVFDYQDEAERKVYDRVRGYIEKRFRELETEKPGKGFVMTIYQRRASSSPLALERSLERRRSGLERVSQQRAIDPEIKGAVINYDLPWNPSKVEQRIGRIDRIGQKLERVLVVNLFLKKSVDDDVYHVLRERCGVFEHFVGAMQPVLARARRMLLGQAPVDLSALRSAADQVRGDPLATETYFDSDAGSVACPESPVTRDQIEAEFVRLRGEAGAKVKRDEGASVLELTSPGLGKARFSSRIESLESDRALLPLSPLEASVRELAERFNRPGERLPLVLGSAQSGAFRAIVAGWIENGRLAKVESLVDLERRIEAWDGDYPDPDLWVRSEMGMREEAQLFVDLLERKASRKELDGLERQRSAARFRVLRELGRFLACLGEGVSDLNALLHRQMSRDIASARRLREALEKLGGYPEWPDDLCKELDAFSRELSENKRKARLLGGELEAALQDPRWRTRNRL